MGSVRLRRAGGVGRAGHRRRHDVRLLGLHPDGGVREALRHLAPRRDRFMLAVSRTRASAWPSPGASSARFSHRLRPRDVLLLAYWNHRMRPRVLDAARTLQRRGLVNYVAVSCHNRSLAASFAASGDYDIVHLRYNAAHPGAERDCFPRLPARTGPDRLVHRHELGPAPQPRYTPDGERTPTAKRLLPVRPLPPGCRCVRDGTGVGRSRRAGHRCPRARPDVGGGTGVDEARRRGGSPACLDQAIDTDRNNRRYNSVNPSTAHRSRNSTEDICP